MEVVDIAGQIPATFFTLMDSKKWSERKEALDIIEKITSVPKIKDSDFSELVRILKRTIAKDSNIVVVAAAAKCMCQLAQGLRTNFAPYSNGCMTVLFEKFKEKKPNVINVLRDAADAVFVGTNLENTLEDITQFLDNKNPQIKSEMALFLARTFSQFPLQVRNKKTLRPIINSLMKTLNDMDSTVRDNSAMAIGTAMKVIGEAAFMPLIADVEPIKVTKIKEFCDKAEIACPNQNGRADILGENQMPNGQPGSQIPQENGTHDGELDDEDSTYDLLDAIDIFGQIPATFFTLMDSKKWSERKEALDIIEKITSVPKIKDSDFSELVRILKRTIAKDSNIVVVAAAAKCMCQLAQGLRTNFAPYSNGCMTVLFEKFKEKKPNVISVLRDAADAVFVGTNLENTLEDITQFLDNKNPQIKSEMALFLARTFSQFPVQVRNKKTLRPIINSLMKTLNDMDSTVRDNSAMAIGTAMKVIGEAAFMPLIADVEPIKVTKIKEFCEKAQVKKVPQSVLNAISNNCASTAPMPVTQPPVVPKSSATMVRPASHKRLLPKVAPQRTAPQKAPANSMVPNSSATVKRTATIIKRSVASPAKGKSTLSMPPPPLVAPVPQQPTQNAAPLPAHQNAFAIQNSTPAKPIFSHPQIASLSGLDVVIFNLISDNYDEVACALKEIEVSLCNETEKLVVSRINHIINLACWILTRNYDGSDGARKVQTVSECLTTLLANHQVASAVSHQSIRSLLLQVFILSQCKSSQDSIILNKLCATLMEIFEPATLMSILTELLNDPPPSVSIVEPVKSAIIRAMRLFN